MKEGAESAFAHRRRSAEGAMQSAAHRVVAHACRRVGQPKLLFLGTHVAPKAPEPSELQHQREEELRHRRVADQQELLTTKQLARPDLVEGLELAVVGQPLIGLSARGKLRSRSRVIKFRPRTLSPGEWVKRRAW